MMTGNDAAAAATTITACGRPYDTAVSGSSCRRRRRRRCRSSSSSDSCSGGAPPEMVSSCSSAPTRMRARVRENDVHTTKPRPEWVVERKPPLIEWL